MLFFVFQASARLRILSAGRYLQINMAELSDAAQYMCVASNIAGKTTRLFNLAVHGIVTVFVFFLSLANSQFGCFEHIPTLSELKV